MYLINSKNYFKENEPNYRQKNNLTNPLNYNKFSNNSFQKENENTANSTYNSINPLNNLSNFERYKNRQLLNREISPSSSCKCICHSNSKNSPLCRHCKFHNFHIHHIHIPIRQIYDCNNRENSSNHIDVKIPNNDIDSSKLLKEVIELRNECKKFKEDLDKSNPGLKLGEHMRDLENLKLKNFDLHSDNYENKGPEFRKIVYPNLNNLINENNRNNMDGILSKHIYNSGNKTYVINDDNDIEDNKIGFNDLNNLNYKSVFEPNLVDKFLNSNNLQINKDNYRSANYYNNASSVINNNDNYKKDLKGINDGKLSTDPYSDFLKNNKKGYIIKNENRPNYNRSYSLSLENPNNENNHRDIINNNKTYPYDNNLIKKFNNDDNENQKDNANKINEINPELINLMNKDEDANPLNYRYLIVDKDGHPIIRNQQKVLGMELIPLIGKDGKEKKDQNGNIILIGPDGKPKSQDELKPIILDDNKPLVNEENKPILGFDGIPLISGNGNPLVNPDQIYDSENKPVIGLVGIVPKDNMGNPVKLNIKGITRDKLLYEKEDLNNPTYNILGNNNNNEKKHDTNGENPKNQIKNKINYNKLKPLIGPDGIPMKDTLNNFIILDDKNIPVLDSGITVLLDKYGKPILNSSGEPILLDSDGNPINADNNNCNQPKKYLKKQFLGQNFVPKPPKEKNVKDRNKVYHINEPSRLNNKKKNLKNKKGNKKLNPKERSNNSLKKIKNMSSYKNLIFNSSENKLNCLACDVGCSVSKSGYSIMNFSPYNNRIRRRNITPVMNRRNYILSKKIEKDENINLNKINP